MGRRQGTFQRADVPDGQKADAQGAFGKAVSPVGLQKGPVRPPGDPGCRASLEEAARHFPCCEEGSRKPAVQAARRGGAAGGMDMHR